MRSGSIVVCIALAVLGGCFEDTPGNGESTSSDNGTSACEPGLLGCSCFPNGTCSADYVCFSGECREPEVQSTSEADSTTTTAADGTSTTTASDSTTSSDPTTSGESSTGGAPTHLLFVSSSQHTGLDVGGLGGADTICTNAGQPLRRGPWRAVLRDAVSTFEGRIEVDGEVYNTNGELLAVDGPSLFSDVLQALPAYDENGAEVPMQDLVWTGSSVDDCIGWTTDDPMTFGAVGLPHDAERWLDSTIPLPCSGSPRLYCISQ